MANYTTNYNLKKPLQTEYYNVDDFNGNADILDAGLKAAADAAAKAKNYYTLVAASDSSAAFKAAADFVCDGTDDQTEIGQAINSTDGKGKAVLFAPGTYNLGSLKVSTDDLCLEGIGEVKVVLSALIDIAAENVNFKNIKFSHTAGFTDTAFIRLNGFNGKMADGVCVKDCVFDLSGQNDHIFASSVVKTNQKGIIRLIDYTLLCTYAEYDLIKPDTGVWVSCAVTGCAALPPTYNGSVSVKVDANDFSSYNKFSLAGNINFDFTART
jgi:hypothetical protein